MTVMARYAAAILATGRRDALIFLSYRLRVGTQILALLFTLTMFHYIAKLVRPDAVGTGGRYYSFVVIGIVIMAVMTSALGTADIVRMELMQGNFERIVVSPLGPVAGTVSVAAFPIFYATILAAAMLGLAGAIFGVPVHAAGLPGAVAVSALGATAFAGIGFFFVAGLFAYKSSAGATWVVAGLGLLGGAYFPIRVLPGWSRWIAEVQPLTPTVDLLRHFLLGTPTLHPIATELLKLGVFTAVLIPAALTVLRLAIGWSRRRGTLMEF